MVEHRVLRIDHKIWMSLLLLGFTLWIIIHGITVIIQIGAAIYGGYLLSLLLRPPSAYLERRFKIDRGLSVSVLLILVQLPILIFASILVQLVFMLIQTTAEGSYSLMTYLNTTSISASSIDEILRLFNEMAGQSASILGASLNQVTDTAPEVVHYIMLFALANVTAYSFAANEDTGDRILREWVVPEYRAPARRILNQTREKLSRWVMSQMTSMAIFSVVFGTGLYILGVPNAGIIAVVGGILEIAPGLGGFIAFIIAAISAYTTGQSWLPAWVFILYIAVVILQNNFLNQFLFEKRLEINSVHLILAIIIGGKIFGIWGGLFAIPVLVVVIALLDEIRGYYMSRFEGEGQTPSESDQGK
jgi:predicted PurR-regulated permease PerM